MSSRRKPGGGFTFEVQQLSGEDLGGGLEGEAFSGCVVVDAQEGKKALGREGSEIGFARDEAAQPADGVLDAAFLPRGVGVAEEGLDAEVVELVVAGELGAIVEG